MSNPTLIAAENRLREHFGAALPNLLRGSDFFGDSRQWCLARHPYAQYVSDGQRILDLGCANGLLLKSIQIWTGADCECFGIDNNPMRIASARKLFSSSNPENFLTGDMFAGEWAKKQYDLVFFPFHSLENWIQIADTFIRRNPTSTLILSVYDDEWDNADTIDQICSKIWDDLVVKVYCVENLVKLVSLTCKRHI